MLECALNAVSNCKHAGTKKLLESAVFLNALTLVKQEIAWYLTNGHVSVEAAAELAAVHDQAVKAFCPFLNTAVEGLGLPPIEQLYGPIARDYVAFNAQNDCENFDAAGKLFDPRTTGMPRARM